MSFQNLKVYINLFIILNDDWSRHLDVNVKDHIAYAK